MPNDNCGLRFQKLDVYVAAREIARLVNQAQIGHAELRDQAQRASISCFLQLAEGLPNRGAGMRRKYFTESNNSLHEVVARSIWLAPWESCGRRRRRSFRSWRFAPGACWRRCCAVDGSHGQEPMSLATASGASRWTWWPVPAMVSTDSFRCGKRARNSGSGAIIPFSPRMARIGAAAWAQIN